MRVRNLSIVAAMATVAAVTAMTGCSGTGAVGVPQTSDQRAATSSAIGSSAYRVPTSARDTSDATGTGAFHMQAFAANTSLFPAILTPEVPILAPPCSAKKTSRSVRCGVEVNLLDPVLALGTPVTSLLGLLPGMVRSIYDLAPLQQNAGAGRTVAIVTANDDPNAEADLAVYRNAFGMKPCTTANGCFTKIAQDGSAKLPAVDLNWAIETSADMDSVSSTCPGCNIMVVEANSSDISDLALAVDRAVAKGATVVTNSYGVPEAADNVVFDSHYNHPGTPIVVAAGDDGYGVNFPASSAHVIAVGGTTLYGVGNGLVEVAWSKTASGCSAFIAKPSWQKDAGCAKRTMNDMAAVADPATGIAMYDSTLAPHPGWSVVGGTSIASPLVAGLVATSSNPANFSTAAALYKNTAGRALNITAGANGICFPLYLCSGGFGYNGPTGWGSPTQSMGFNG